MKILWVCSGPLPEISRDMGEKARSICGWLEGFANVLKSMPDIELHIAFPHFQKQQIFNKSVGNLKYYSLTPKRILPFLKVGDQGAVTTQMQIDMKRIIDFVNPDVLHIFGTEMAYANVAAKVFGKPEKTLVNIQGLVYACEKHYLSGIPYESIKMFAISNLVRGDMLKQAKRYGKLGEMEKDTLRHVKHVVGRTDWDEACTLQVNPELNYYFCNENLRDSFYGEESWSYDKCQKHSLFVSQGNYPIKGLHFALQALKIVLERYPDTVLYVSGRNQTNTKGLYNKLRISAYGVYLNKLIKKYRLEKNVHFLGMLSEQDMHKRFLASHVFVSPSSLENSPNSVGEAMMLGVPCVVSDVGGVRNMMTDKTDGFIYPHDEYYMLAHYIMKIFENEKIAEEFSENSKKHARVTHDRKKNAERLIEIYKLVNGGK